MNATALFYIIAIVAMLVSSISYKKENLRTLCDLTWLVSLVVGCILLAKGSDSILLPYLFLAVSICLLCGTLQKCIVESKS